MFLSIHHIYSVTTAMSYYTDPYARPSAPYQTPYGAPPPLPPGWYQEWEPSIRRAFWVEDATGRAQWETPYAPPLGEGYYDEARSGPSGVYEERGYYHEHEHGYREEKSHSDAGKYLAAGVAGLAVGGVAGAVVEHEIG